MTPYLLIGALAFLPGDGTSTEEKSAGDELDSAITAYFKEPDAAKRADISVAIHKASVGSMTAVADALTRVCVWDANSERRQTVAVASAADRDNALRVTLPADYDPTKRHALLLALVGRSDAGEAAYLDRMAEEYVVARVADFSGITFNGPRERADEPRRWLAALKRRYHLDTDRVYLYGGGIGADAAFVVAFAQPDLFAGIVIREGMLDVPYHRELQRILLANLGDTPLHLIWTRPDLPPETVLTGRSVRVALANQSTMRHAETAGLPITKTVLSPSTTFDPSAWSHVFEHRLPASVDTVAHWFRYPQQGRARFLRPGEFAGPVWEGDQIDIQVPPTVDRSPYITQVLQSKLARLTGRIDGQSIEIESTRCDTVEIHLEPAAVDWSLPIHIRYNGKRRLDERVRPKIDTLLESAYSEWEFQHPTCVRLRVGKRGRVLPF